MQPPPPATVPAPDSHWLSLKLNLNEAAIWSADKMTVYAQRVVNDLMVARSETPPCGRISKYAERTTSLPLGLDWRRWSLGSRCDEVRFWPAFPDKPIVVKTRIPVTILPRTSLELYINIPIWLEISAAAEGEAHQTVDKLAPTRLSHTWYGTHFEGQLCYALKSRARQSADDLDREPLRAACRFTIHNRSDKPLPVEKIRVIPEHLDLYSTPERLWTNCVTVVFADDAEGSSVSYDLEQPSFLGKAKLLRQAAKPFERKSLLDRFIFNPLGFDQ